MSSLNSQFAASKQSIQPSHFTHVRSQECCSSAWHFHPRVEPALSDSQLRCRLIESGGSVVFRQHFITASITLCKNINSLFIFKWKSWRGGNANKSGSANEQAEELAHSCAYTEKRLQQWMNGDSSNVIWTTCDVSWLPPFSFSRCEQQTMTSL